MSETASPVSLVVALVVGVALGLAHSAGLWFTIKRLRQFRSPKLMLVGSMLLRNVVTIAGFYLVMGGSALRLCVCLAGFVVARTLLNRWLIATLPVKRDGA